MAWNTPNTVADDDSISAANHNTYIRDNLNYLIDNLPFHAVMFHWDSEVVTGNALANVISTGQGHNRTAAQTAAADGDTFRQSFVLAAGTYSLVVYGVKQIAGGKIDWYIDDVAIDTGQDWYAAAPTQDVTFTITPLTITTGGRHILKGIVNGKHASSSGYAIRLTTMTFNPASEA